MCSRRQWDAYVEEAREGQSPLARARRELATAEADLRLVGGGGNYMRWRLARAHVTALERERVEELQHG